MRMKNLPHNMNIVSCDLNFNKIMHKFIIEVENGLQINLKYKQGAKNRAIQQELKEKQITSNKLKRN